MGDMCAIDDQIGLNLEKKLYSWDLIDDFIITYA